MNTIDIPAKDNNSNLFKFKQQRSGQTGNGGTEDVEIMISLKYLSKVWRTLEMPLINGKFILQLTSSKRIISVAGIVPNQEPTFKTNTKLYVPVATLSSQENIKLLKQL